MVERTKNQVVTGWIFDPLLSHLNSDYCFRDAPSMLSMPFNAAVSSFFFSYK